MRSLLRRLLGLEKEKEAKPEVEKTVERKFYFVFRSADGTMSVRHGIHRSDLQAISDKLAICVACPEISSLTLVATPEKPGK
jgi:hypothetical protein